MDIDRVEELIRPGLATMRGYDPIEPIDVLEKELGKRIVKLDGMDYIVGGTTRVTYGVTTRLLAKRREGAAGASARAVEAVRAVAERCLPAVAERMAADGVELRATEEACRILEAANVPGLPPL